MTTKDQTDLNQAALEQQGDQLYAQYVKPLEQKHAGKYVAVSPQGKVVLASTLVDVMKKAEAELGSGNFVFKVGDIVVGSWL
jgi:hypothetical protein